MSDIYITSKPRLFPDLRDAWQHRRLAMILAQRAIKIRYMQTILGSAWIVIQPLLLTGVLTIVGGMLLHAPSQGIPYPLFAFTGTVIWSLFQRVLIDTSTSLALSGPIILKVYFPRILVPISSVLTATFDILPVSGLLLVIVAISGYWPGWPILLAPIFIVLAAALAFAIGLIVTMLDAIYRDVRLIMPTVLQLVFYVTPIMYAEDLVPQQWRVLYEINPIVALVNAFRWSTIAGMPPPSAYGLISCAGLTAFILAGGLYVFARLEQFAVDRI